jgi:hypothetical protein
LESSIKGEEFSWIKFREAVAPREGKRFLFRGQANPWKLRSAFHRKRRYNLGRYLSQDVPALHRYLTARTAHVFNLDIPNENGAFFNLAQHHGYPTPLIDWSYSPYVAAFFAFHRIPKDQTQTEPARIYVFDHESWRRDWRQLLTINTSGPHLSQIEFLAIENERMIPQQAASTVTNIDDVESYLLAKGKEKNLIYIAAVDIPATERNHVMQELAYMGITAGSMFPGLDGTCEELRERFFDN